MKNARENRGRLLFALGLVALCLLIVTANPEAATSRRGSDGLYYYSGSVKIPLKVSTEKIAVRFEESVGLEQRKAIVQSKGDFESFDDREESEAYSMTLLPLKEGLTGEDVAENIGFLDSQAEVAFSSPVFELWNGVMVLTDELSVEFGADVPEDEITALNFEYNVEVVRKLSTRRKWYLLRVKSPKGMRCLDVANAYNESPLTVFSLPKFMTRVKAAAVTPDDYYFSDQWPLDNTGQTGGQSNADINAPEGWDISTGSSNIVIAVIDTGVDLDHDDLENKLVDGYDSDEGDNDPSPETTFDGDGHGTACAGLAAAETNNNEIGISGVGWNCMLMPIRVAHVKNVLGHWETDNVKLADGIQWAWENGADVLSNSWGNFPDWDDVHNAIKDAKNNGRNGKGCVLVCAAGNDNSSVIYPAKYVEVIAVGATNDTDERWWYSNYGPELDVVAPSGSGGVLPPLIMWTTDITGSYGYNPGGDLSKGDVDGNYTKWMGGTSGATPEVAGLAGLILSVNPELTANEVQFIIESTADDQIGNPLEDTEGWDKYYGWGRINNESALLEASSFSIDDTLFGWWKFDETTGTTAEDSAGDNNGTLNNFPPAPWVTGKINGALDFDGTDDYVVLDHSVGALKVGPVTISAWIKADDLNALYHPVVSTYYRDGLFHYGYLLFIYRDEQEFYPAFYLGYDQQGQPAISDIQVNIFDWYHIAGTYDGSDLKIYVNGGPPTTIQLEGLTGYYEPYDDTYIGYEDELSDGVYFDGKIDDVRVYRRALDIFEIWDAMSGDLPRFRIKNSSDETVAWFDSFGNLILKGTFDQWSSYTAKPDRDEFRVQGPGGYDVAIIDATDGNMYITGTKYENHNMVLYGQHRFIVKDSKYGYRVAYINDLGNLYLKGELYENQ